MVAIAGYRAPHVFVFWPSSEKEATVTGGICALAFPPFEGIWGGIVASKAQLRPLRPLVLESAALDLGARPVVGPCNRILAPGAVFAEVA